MQVVAGPDSKPRCAWAVAAPEMLAYHDTEWGFSVRDDVRLFEKLSLEAFQSGLSWRTILAKRDNFRAAFAGFDFDQVARFGARDVKRLLTDAGIVRHRGKIEAVIHNARQVRTTVGDGSLAGLVWAYEPRRRAPVDGHVPSTSPESEALAKHLKAHGWRFVGPTTAYAFMQSMGLVNDHLDGCVMRAPAERARRGFDKPA